MKQTRALRSGLAVLALAAAVIITPGAAQASGFGNGAPAGQAASGTPTSTDASTSGLLDWYFCWRYGKPSGC